MSRKAIGIVLLMIVAFTGCADTGGRYRLRVDPASRYNFRYVQDPGSGLWVHRECEVRVSVKRRLPDPISSPEHGDLLHSSRFEPGSVGTGNLSPTKFVIENGYRVWRFQELLGEHDFTGKAAFGIQVEWPVKDGPSREEPLELFALPPPDSIPPDQWSTWRTADHSRLDAFGWWNEVSGAPPEAMPEIPFPFELRFRLLLKDHLYVD
ncbi:MAG TPA: hypothetical protein VN634_19115 [Candidatus Limnocylindrales bacterium]|nr:hypothetical protein [Candidatus Limnocylindrales bacterium]